MQKRQGKENKCEVKRLTQYGFKIYAAMKRTLSALSHTAPYVIERASFSD